MLGLAPEEGSWTQVGEPQKSTGAPVTDFGTIPLAQIRQQHATREGNPAGHPDRDDPAGPVLDKSDPKLDPYRGQFTVRLTVTSPDGTVLPGVDRKVLTAIDDPTLRPGFPKRLGAGGEAPLRYADLNGDNVQEMVLPTEDGLVHAYRPDGSELPGWPVRTETQFSAREHLQSPALKALAPPLEPPRGPTIADLTGDGLPEVITAAGERLYAWNSAGKLLPGWPVNPDPGRANCALSEQEKERKHPKCGFLATPAVARLEGPGKPLDVVAPGLDGRLRAYRPDGTSVPGFPVRLIDPDVPSNEQVTAESINQPAIGDLDGDKHDDIIVPTNEVYGGESGASGGDVGFGGLLSQAGTTARVYAVRSTGTASPGGKPFFPGWPVKPGGIIQNVLPLIGPGHDPALVEVNGEKQVLVSVTGGALTLYDTDGELGSPREIQQNVGRAEGALNLFESAAVGDLDGVGGPDITKYQVDLGQAANLLLVGQNVPYSHRIGAFNAASGTTIGAYPEITDDYQFLSSSTVGKVTGGTTSQVIAGTGLGLLHAYDGLTAKDAPGFPKVTGGWLLGPAALSDDGRIAGITREGFLFEWDAPDTPPCQAEWPSFRHDPQGSGNYDRDGTAPAAPDQLSLGPSGGNSFSLSFRSPGDDGFCGKATRYVADVDGQDFVLGPPADGGSVTRRNITLPAGARRVTIRAADGPAGEAFNLGAPGAIERAVTGGGFTPVTAPGTKPGTKPSARKPRLKLGLRFRAGRTRATRRGAGRLRCARSGVRVTVLGADRRRAVRATFRVARRLLRDKRRPLSRVFRDRHRGASHRHRVRVGVRLRSGRLVKLTRRTAYAPTADAPLRPGWPSPPLSPRPAPRRDCRRCRCRGRDRPLPAPRAGRPRWSSRR